MPRQSLQTILAGSAQLLVGDAPTVESTEITTLIDNAGSPAYTALTTELIVDDASVIAPNVWEISAGSIADPPVVDVICAVRTGETMFCYKRTDATDTIFVIRGVSKTWEKYAYLDTQFNSATSVIDDAELQLLGSFTFPTRNNMVTTNGDVAVNATQATFKTRDNRKGFESAFTSEPANCEMTCTLPHNTIASTMKIMGIQGITDGNLPERFFAQPGRASAGTALPEKLIVVIPNTLLDALTTALIDGNNHLDINSCVIIPKAQPSLEWVQTYSEGAQIELALTVQANFSDVWQSLYYYGVLQDMCRISEIIV